MAGVNVLIQRLERMAASDVKHRIMQKVAPVVHDECLRGFREQRDPYGIPWAPRKNKRGGWKILDKSGRGVESVTTRPVGDTVSLRMVGYMRFHQTGTSRMVARREVPEQSQGLGTWSQPINRAAVDAVTQMAKGNG